MLKNAYFGKKRKKTVKIASAAPIVTSNSVVFVDGERKNISWPGRRVP